jgi:hypothetical protein
VLCLEPVQGVLLGLSLYPPTPLHEAAEDIAALSLSGAVRGDDAAALWSSLAAAHACEAGAPEGLPACLGCGGLAGWKVKGLQALCRALTLPTSGTKPELLVSWWGSRLERENTPALLRKCLCLWVVQQAVCWPPCPCPTPVLLQMRLGTLEEGLPRHLPLSLVLAARQGAAEADLWSTLDEDAAAERAGKRLDRVTASTAKAQFLLTDSHLALIPCQRKRNPHCSSGAPMRLYSRNEVQALATCVHGGMAAVLGVKQGEADGRRERRVEARRERHAEEVRHKQERQEKLQAA